MTPHTPSPLGGLLRSHRERALFSLEGLADRSGVSGRTISDIERGISAAPQRRTLLALVTALQLADAERDEFLQAARAGRSTPSSAARSASLEPRRLPDFTGRTTEMTELLAFLEGTDGTKLAAAPVALLHGAPGMGKTAMAVEALHRRQSHISTALFVDLNGLDMFPLTALQVLQALLKQLLPFGAQIPKTLDAAVVMWRDKCLESPVAVLLDNAGSEAQVRPVLTSAHEGAVIVTSRRPLAGLEGVRRFPLGPLPPEDSTALLADIVAPNQREGSLTELAVLCGHTPLALRIAGNRLASQQTWTVGDFLERLRLEENRLRTLVAGDLAVETAFTLSYAHLKEDRKNLFRTLSLLKGATFSAPLAAAASTGTDTVDRDSGLEVQDGLDELVDLGLVQALTGNRYRLHDLLRLYAAGRLRAERSGDDIAAHRTHLRSWLLASSVNAGNWYEPRPVTGPLTGDPGAVFTDAGQAMHWLQAETADWFGAYQDAVSLRQHPIVLQVAASLRWFSGIWDSWGKWHQVFSDSVASATASGDKALIATHLNYLAYVYTMERQEPERGRQTALRALHEAIESGSILQQAWARSGLALSHRFLDRDAEAMVHAQKALDGFRATNTLEAEQHALILIGELQRRLGELDAGIETARTLLTLIKDPRTPVNIRGFTEFTALHLLCQLYDEAQRHEESLKAAHSALQLAEQMHWPHGQASALLLRGRANNALKRYSSAAQDLALALGKARTAGDRRLEEAIRSMSITVAGSLGTGGPGESSR